MTDDVNFFEWAFKGLISILLVVGGWLWKMLIVKVKEQDKDIEAVDDGLSEHKLYSERMFTTKNESNRQYDELTKKIDRVLDIMENRNNRLHGDR